MVNLILKFTEFCRASDLKVSTSEALNTLSQLALIDLLDETQFKTVLGTNFVKTSRDKSHFDRLYNIFFHDLNDDKDDAQIQAGVSEARKDILDEIRDANEDDSIVNSIMDFLEGDPLSFLEQLMRLQNADAQDSKAVKSNLGGLAGRLEIMLRLNKIEGRIMQLTENASNTNAAGQQRIDRYFTRRLNTARRMLSEEKKPDNKGLKQVKSLTREDKGLGEKFFSSLTLKEIEEMRVIINELAKKMKDILTRRWAVRNKGVLDIKKTLRKAGQYNGVPLELVYKKRPPKKGKVITLCDISGSVWSAARFMLNMLYSLQDCFARVRSFAFVSQLAEVTDTFDENDINDAIEMVMTHSDLDHNALTDYGETFRGFQNRYLHILNRKTTLIIVGDGRSNYFDPGETALENIREKCRRVIWLNPEPEQFWGNGDSEMKTYMAYCHEVRPCQNLNQLTSFIQELVL